MKAAQESLRLSSATQAKLQRELNEMRTRIQENNSDSETYRIKIQKLSSENTSLNEEMRGVQENLRLSSGTINKLTNELKITCAENEELKKKLEDENDNPTSLSLWNNTPFSIQNLPLFPILRNIQPFDTLDPDSGYLLPGVHYLEAWLIILRDISNKTKHEAIPLLSVDDFMNGTSVCILTPWNNTTVDMLKVLLRGVEEVEKFIRECKITDTPNANEDQKEQKEEEEEEED